MFQNVRSNEPTPWRSLRDRGCRRSSMGGETTRRTQRNYLSIRAITRPWVRRGKRWASEEKNPPDGRGDDPADAEELFVNSSHHQAVGTAGKSLDIVGTSPADGVIEALEGRDPKQFVLGAQWPPGRSYG